MFYYNSPERNAPGPFNPHWDSTVGGQAPMYYYGSPSDGGPLPPGVISPPTNVAPGSPQGYGTGLRSWSNIPKPGTMSSGFIGGTGSALYRALGLGRGPNISQDSVVEQSLIREAYAAANSGDCAKFASVMNRLEKFYIDRGRDPLASITAIFDSHPDLDYFYKSVMSDVSMGGTKNFCTPGPIGPPPPGPPSPPGGPPQKPAFREGPGPQTGSPPVFAEDDSSAALMARMMAAEAGEQQREQELQDLESATAQAMFDAQNQAAVQTFDASSSLSSEQQAESAAFTVAPPQTGVQSGPQDLPPDYAMGAPVGATSSGETETVTGDKGGFGGLAVGAAVIGGILYYLNQN